MGQCGAGPVWRQAKAALETELQDTKARIDKLQEDLDELQRPAEDERRSEHRMPGEREGLP